MEKTRNKQGFSQRHPLLFGMILVIMAVALVMGAMAFFRGGSLNMARMGGDAIGVVYIEGMLLDATPVVDWLEELRRDDDVKGVVLRVDCPGGTVAPSQEIYREVELVARDKPVVASFATVAASGGYYASSPASSIVANPGSITASIGVRMEYLTFKDLMDEWGIHQEQLVSGDVKGAGSPFQDLTDEQRAALMDIVMDLHEQFVTDVARARGLDVEQVKRIADGPALTGRQALNAGLVDALGGLEDAYRMAKELAGVEGEARLIEGPVEERSFIQEVLGEGSLDDIRPLLAPRWIFLYH
mgnify:FL=1